MSGKVWFVRGGPGVGKTSYLRDQAERAVEKHGLDDVVIASLTRTAAHEIGQRVPQLPDHAVGTMHSHAYHALHCPDLAEVGDGLKAWNQEHPDDKLGRGRLDEIEDGNDETSLTATAVHAQVKNLRAAQIPVDQWTDDQRAWHHRWEHWKTKQGLLDFTDLIEQAIHAGAHAALPAVLLLDECQDFSRLELQLATTWAEHAQTTVLVGDIWQSIYRFRGADPDQITGLNLAGTRSLDKSWRVPQAIRDHAVAWATQLPGPAWTYEPRAGDPGYLTHSNESLRYPAGVVNLAEHRLAEHPDQTVMLLTTCGYQLEGVIKELRDRGIPFHNPYRGDHGSWNPLRGAGGLLAYLRPNPDAWGKDAANHTWRDLHRALDPLEARCLPRGTKARVKDMLVKDQYGNSMADQVVPLDRLGELLGTGQSIHVLLKHPLAQGDVDWWQQNLRNPERQKRRYVIDVYRQHGGQALREKPRLILGTIHSVKGGEADHVIVAPDLSRAAYWNSWQQPLSPGWRQLVCTLYVALTRARQGATLLAPSVPEHLPTTVEQVAAA